MPRPPARPGVETLDQRQVPSASRPTLIHAPVPQAAVAPAYTVDDLQGFANSYLSTFGDPRYNARYDTNHNGQIGQGDVLPILQTLAPITPHVRPDLQLALAPGEQVQGHHPADSGGVTRLGTVTVVGKTTPNAIIFTDGPLKASNLGVGDFKFRGVALVSNAQGYFSYTIPLNDLAHSGSETGTAYLVKDPFGRHMVRAFNILRLR